ncbi:unnamed protein product [Choristocarpus tenellus]
MRDGSMDRGSQSKGGKYRGNTIVRFLSRPSISRNGVALVISFAMLMYILCPPLDGKLRGETKPWADTVVFVAMGRAAASYSLLYALQSLRDVGRWEGSVHVVVDDVGKQLIECLPERLTRPLTLVLANTSTEGEGTITQAKLSKTHLLDLLPQEVRNVLYVDCDVITQRSLEIFWSSLNRTWEKERGKGGSASSIAIFHDAAGHTVPFCTKCDEAHSGVVALKRGKSELCLQLWREAFLTSGVATDQEALDLVLQGEGGCSAQWLSWRHMRFMKDIFVVAGVTRKRTFAHFTSLLHPARLSGVHRRHYSRTLGLSYEYEWGTNEGTFQRCAST